MTERHKKYLAVAMLLAGFPLWLPFSPAIALLFFTAGCVLGFICDPYDDQD